MKKKILSVDDNELILEFMEDLLSKEGYRVEAAKDGLSALDILKVQTPDVIFIDLIMPGIDGKKLIQVIRGMDRFKDVYIIILSASLAEEKINIAELGADAMIAKGPLLDMGQHILDVLNRPDLASSKCLAGDVIGLENVFPSRMTTELFSVNRRFDAILQGMRDGILEITSNGRVIFANRAAFSMLGEAEESVLGSHLVDLFGEDNRQRIQGLGGSAVAAEADVQVIAGGRRLELALIPIGKGDANRIVVVSDVTEAYEARDALETSHEQLTEIIAKNTDAMLIVSRDGRVIFANPAAEVLLQGGLEGLVGSDFGFPVAPDESIELNLRSPDKEQRVAEMRAAEVAWRGEKVYLASLRDITERKQMEESLRSANQMILDQQKTRIEEERLRVLLQMAGAAAHELSQPLTTLLGNIELLMMERDVPEVLSKRLVKIGASGKKISDIVRKIRAVRRYETKPYAGGGKIVDFYHKSNFLIVEDEDEDYGIVDAIFKTEKNIHLTRARDMAGAFKILEQDEIDLILMDYLLPDGNAFEVIEAVNDKGLEIPIVVITGHGDEMTATRIIQAGAADYLTKDTLTKESLSRSVNNALEKGRLNKELKIVRERLTEMATRDDLTGLYNRRYAMETLEKELERAKRYHTPMSLCMIDLDHFKNVNDSYGHSAGDTVLTAVGKLLNDSARQTDTACRYGGEEFVLILPNTDENGAMTFCERLREDVARHEVKWNGSSLDVTISIGIAQYDEEKDRSPADLVERADKALYRAKEEGRNRVVRF